MWLCSTTLDGDGSGAIATWLHMNLRLEPMMSVLNQQFFGGQYPWYGVDPTCNTRHNDKDTYFYAFLCMSKFEDGAKCVPRGKSSAIMGFLLLVGAILYFSYFVASILYLKCGFYIVNWINRYRSVITLDLWRSLLKIVHIRRKESTQRIGSVNTKQLFFSSL